MGEFNKTEYNIMYTKNNMKQIKLGVCKEDFARFEAHCTNLGVNKTAYLKNLVNKDAIERGLEPVFAPDRRFKK